ncbi:MAG: ATP-binding protein [Thermodesulfovibrionales bacterium]
MNDEDKPREQLIHELEEMRRALAKSEESVSEVKKTEKELQGKLFEYEKLSALGRLTANVAHEIRNPITVIGGLVKRLEKGMLPGAQEKEYLDLISSEARRLEGILRDVLVFSNKAFFHREKQGINKIVDEVLDVHDVTLRSQSIQVHKTLGAVSMIYIDTGHVKEAINNLISNAIDAMPNGGTLTATTDEYSVNEKHYVVVKITDTGAGISEDKIGLVFEPFFTTKITKKETGLGLPLTKKIVEGHGGFIRIESTAGKGSTFSLYFPFREG